VCDDAQLLVLETNVRSSDSKESFVNYCSTNNVEYPAVWSGEGGRAIADALGIGVVGNAKYFIRPDKTFKYGVYTTDFEKEGIEEHTCGVDHIAPVVSVLTPGEGLILIINEEYDITWTATDNVGVVSTACWFSADKGETWELIDSTDSNTGSYTWTVPDMISDSCKIEIHAYDSTHNKGVNESGLFCIRASTFTQSFQNGIDRLIRVKQRYKTMSVYIPFAGASTVTIMDVQGKKLYEQSIYAENRWYDLPVNISHSMRILSIRNENSAFIRKVGVNR